MNFPEILQQVLVIAKILALLAVAISAIVLTVKALPALKWLALKLERDKDNGENLASILIRCTDLPRQVEKTLKSADEALWKAGQAR